jgi:prepilin-type processing-associated H-X9-DG protein/prepilin-type N-terminal cleavage/methylation domain-containing protein
MNRSDPRARPVRRSPGLVLSEIHRDAFTLVELLVVLGVVALLVAILLPALQRGNRSARSAGCKSNLRQLGTAMMLYVQETHRYQGFYTFFTVDELRNQSWGCAPGIARWLPYLGGNHRVFYCSAQSSLNIPAVYPLLTTNGMAMEAPISYGWNAMGTGIESPPRRDLGLGPRWKEGGLCETILETRVLVPADMISITDNELGTHDNCIVSPNNSWSTFRVGDRHQSGANVLFCDGHVEYQKRPLLTAPSDGARQRWNNDHLPHRETW